MNRFRRSASSAQEEGSTDGGSPAPTTSVGRPPDRPPLPPYLVVEDAAPAELRGGTGCVVGWGLPYGKPTPDRFELQWGFAIKGSWTHVEPPVTDCRRLTVRPVGRPKDGIGERWCYRLEGLKPKTRYVVQVRGVNAAGPGDWSKSGKITVEATVLNDETDEAAIEDKKTGGFTARIPFGRRSTSASVGAESVASGSNPEDDIQSSDDGGAFAAQTIDYAALVRSATEETVDADPQSSAAEPPPPLTRPGSLSSLPNSVEEPSGAPDVAKAETAADGVVSEEQAAEWKRKEEEATRREVRAAKEAEIQARLGKSMTTGTLPAVCLPWHELTSLEHSPCVCTWTFVCNSSIAFSSAGSKPHWQIIAEKAAADHAAAAAAAAATTVKNHGHNAQAAEDVGDKELDTIDLAEGQRKAQEKLQQEMATLLGSAFRKERNLRPQMHNTACLNCHFCEMYGAGDDDDSGADDDGSFFSPAHFTTASSAAASAPLASSDSEQEQVSAIQVHQHFFAFAGSLCTFLDIGATGANLA